MRILTLEIKQSSLWCSSRIKLPSMLKIHIQLFFNHNGLDFWEIFKKGKFSDLQWSKNMHACASCLPCSTVQYSISMIVCEGGKFGKPSCEKMVRCLLTVWRLSVRLLHLLLIAKIHAVLVDQEQVTEVMHTWLALVTKCFAFWGTCPLLVLLHSSVIACTSSGSILHFSPAFTSVDMTMTMPVSTCRLPTQMNDY